MANNLTIQERLRAFLNKAIGGKYTNALLGALAAGDQFNDTNVLAMKQSLVIATAEDVYLEKTLASLGVVKPAEVGIDDNAFRELGVSTTNIKLVKNIFLQILELFYGEDAVKANIIANNPETYPLVDGMDLYILQDNQSSPLRIQFNAADFENIGAAKAIEIASVIAREAVAANSTIYAESYLDVQADLNYLQILSGTRGPRSAITITGGSSQNVFQFPALRPTTQQAGTQFTVTANGGPVKYTWTSGADPGLQNVQVGDYVNLKGTVFPSIQTGSFQIIAVVPNTLGSSYFEIDNPLVQGTLPPYTLGSADDVRFFNPQRNTIQNLTRVATLYEVNPYELVLYIPVTTLIVKRSLIGSWHAHHNSLDKTYLGSYTFNPKSGFSISQTSAPLGQQINAGQIYSVINTNGPTTDFPNSIGYLVFEYGTSNQEGPVRYLDTPSSETLLLDASYTFKKSHAPNSDVMYLNSTSPAIPNINGLDYATYLTGTGAGLVAVENLANQLAAAGIFLNILIVYPKGPGLQNVKDIYDGEET